MCFELIYQVTYMYIAMKVTTLSFQRCMFLLRSIYTTDTICRVRMSFWFSGVCNCLNATQFLFTNRWQTLKHAIYQVVNHIYRPTSQLQTTNSIAFRSSFDVFCCKQYSKIQKRNIFPSIMSYHCTKFHLSPAPK